MAKSSYYGQRGEFVKQVQQELNRLGASLSVDGVWGDKTEQAYQSIGGSSSKIGANAGALSTGVQALQYNILDDAALQKQATEALKGEYDAQVMAEEHKASKLMASIQEAISKLDPLYQERLDILEKNYSVAREGIGEDMLKRGMQRSSHYMDTIGKTHSEQQEQMAKINNAYHEELAELNQEMRNAQAELELSKGMISAQRESAIRQYLDKLTTERDKKLMEMIKYNNSLILQQSKSSKSGGSSSKKANTQYYNDVIGEWDRLTDAGKISFLDWYGSEVKRNDKNLYSYLQSEVSQIKKQGQTLFGAANKQYNYYADAIDTGYRGLR
ncbi:peptidoglycan-binding protein [Eubacteriales bacterium OttesenSCG-928-N14]|nr:peptidoglycan-binding protein [Eubacteriales bacterium OttesenSCG-928-N14]